MKNVTYTVTNTSSTPPNPNWGTGQQWVYPPVKVPPVSVPSQPWGTGSQFVWKEDIQCTEHVINASFYQDGKVFGVCKMCNIHIPLDVKSEARTLGLLESALEAFDDDRLPDAIELLCRARFDIADHRAMLDRIEDLYALLRAGVEAGLETAE